MNGYLGKLLLVDLTTGKTRKLVEQSSWGLGWSPDGAKLVYSENNETGIWVVDVEQPVGRQQIATEGTMPAWSP